MGHVGQVVEVEQGAVIHIDIQSDLFVVVAHMCAISVHYYIVVVVVVVSEPEVNMAVTVIEIERTVLIDNFHHIAYVMVIAVGVLHDLNNGDDDGADDEVV